MPSSPFRLTDPRSAPTVWLSGNALAGGLRRFAADTEYNRSTLIERELGGRARFAGEEPLRRTRRTVPLA
ncbi:MAG: hypothetical protein ACRD2E_00540 [Terriglobales bacterium]